MMLRVLETFARLFPTDLTDDPLALIDTRCDVSHNFVALEDHFDQSLFVHRKGAIRLWEDEIGLVPGSMGTHSYVVEGRGNSHGLCSCSHGAGRAMSRHEALRAISDDDFHASMAGVVYVDDRRLRDEAPGAYKDIEQVMRSQKSLVKVRHVLRPLLSVKGAA
jgi:tRNA-splicing ligase RtcB